MTVGVGAGQMSRVNSARIAAWKAQDAAQVAGDSKSWAQGSVVASDAFFPFADGPELLIDAGVGCLIHPGGSKRDDETFELCEKRGVTCLLTGVRHFRH